MGNSDNKEYAVLGGGCFWCLEAAFEQLEGVGSVVSGYSGGHTADPDYGKVCTGKTGHAEVVRIEYDPSVVSYEQLLELFFRIHDPTSLNRQGADVGTQYRSVILYLDYDQKKAAEKAIDYLEQNKVFANKIVTEIVMLEKFYPAEDYHQNYYKKNPGQGYCSAVITPKLKKAGLKYIS